MTRLPHENRSVRGWKPPDVFSSAILEEVCSHPYCKVSGRENLELHELWPRSFLRGQPIEFVELWDGTIVGNQVYLCNAFQNGHHQMVTENKAEVAWVNGRFFWSEEDWADRLNPQPTLYGSEKAPNAKYSLYGDREGDGSLNVSRGLTMPSSTSLITPDDVEAAKRHISPEPGDECPTCKRRVPIEKKKEPAKHRVTKSIRAPKEKQEDGIEVLEGMIGRAEEILRPGEKPRPEYYTITDALGLFIVHHEEIL